MHIRSYMTEDHQKGFNQTNKRLSFLLLVLHHTMSGNQYISTAFGYELKHGITSIFQDLSDNNDSVMSNNHHAPTAIRRD
jgi:hypothetical protein